MDLAGFIAAAVAIVVLIAGIFTSYDRIKKIEKQVAEIHKWVASLDGQMRGHPYPEVPLEDNLGWRVREIEGMIGDIHKTIMRK